MLLYRLDYVFHRHLYREQFLLQPIAKKFIVPEDKVYKNEEGLAGILYRRLGSFS